MKPSVFTSHPSARPLLVASLALGLLLTACAPPAPGQVDPEPQATATTGAPAKPSPAEQAREKVQASMEKSLKGVSKPSTDAVRKAMQSAVGSRVPVEVSHSVTPTGLEADAVVAAAVVTPKNCVFVYLRDGGISTKLLPVLSTGKCFIGDQGGPQSGS